MLVLIARVRLFYNSRRLAVDHFADQFSLFLSVFRMLIIVECELLNQSILKEGNASSAGELD